MTLLAAQIEQWLLTQTDWVGSADLCARFAIPSERHLRCTGEKPGLISDFTISHSQKGFRHVALATLDEWLTFKNTLKRHAISEMRRVKRLGKVRHNVLIDTTPRCEADNGQGILL